MDGEKNYLFLICPEKNYKFSLLSVKKSMSQKKNHSPPQKIKWLLPYIYVWQVFTGLYGRVFDTYKGSVG